MRKVAVDLGGGADLRERGGADSKEVTEVKVPRESPDVHEEGPAGVGHVGNKDPTIGPASEVPNQPGVNGAEPESALGQGVGNVRIAGVVKDPAVLDGAKVGDDGEASLLRKVELVLVWALLEQLVNSGRGPQVVPNYWRQRNKKQTNIQETYQSHEGGGEYILMAL